MNPKQRRRDGRNCAWKWNVFAMFLFIATANQGVAGTVLFDDFERFSTSAGSLAFSDDSARATFRQVGLLEELGDISLRTQLRVTDGSAGAIVRWDQRQPTPNGYFGVVRGDGKAQLGWAGGDWPVLRETFTELDAAKEDVAIQLEAIGNRISLWVWPVSQAMPEKPILSLTDDAVVSGLAGLVGISTKFPDRGPLEAAFRYVQVADTHVPEPAASVLAALASGPVVLCRCRRRLQRGTRP
jgi:hypothetical protein